MNDALQFYNVRKVDGNIIWLLFLLCGWSYGSLGSIWKQIFYYLTFGGFGIWFIYVLFTLNSKIREYNRKIAEESGVDAEGIGRLGLA